MAITPNFYLRSLREAVSDLGDEVVPLLDRHPSVSYFSPQVLLLSPGIHSPNSSLNVALINCNGGSFLGQPARLIASLQYRYVKELIYIYIYIYIYI